MHIANLKEVVSAEEWQLRVDLDALWDAVRTASGASAQWEKVTPNLLARRFTPPTGLIRNFTHGEANIRALAQAAGKLERIAVLEPLEADRLQRIGKHHQQFRISRRRCRTHDVGVTLGEFAEASRTRLFVPPNRPDLVTPERLG